ncbi:transposable element Tcb2 transposase [Trichonephila clavipes]|nr:transposable element Tcb2 transposase [Trichonephila clavipes]
MLVDRWRIFTWRDRGSRNNPAFVHESVRFCGDGRTDLYIIRVGPLTARRYRDEILRPIVVPYAAAIGDDFILMDDNSRPHRANFVENSLFEEGIVRMEWPACSPDMNPIEHVWDALGRRVAGRQPPPQTLQELERALLEEWDRIPQLVINSFIDSMPQRRGSSFRRCGCRYSSQKCLNGGNKQVFPGASGKWDLGSSLAMIFRLKPDDTSLPSALRSPLARRGGGASGVRPDRGPWGPQERGSDGVIGSRGPHLRASSLSLFFTFGKIAFSLLHPHCSASPTSSVCAVEGI